VRRREVFRSRLILSRLCLLTFADRSPGTVVRWGPNKPPNRTDPDRSCGSEPGRGLQVFRGGTQHNNRCEAAVMSSEREYKRNGTKGHGQRHVVLLGGGLAMLHTAFAHAGTWEISAPMCPQYLAQLSSGDVCVAPAPGGELTVCAVELDPHHLERGPGMPPKAIRVVCGQIKGTSRP
jgi:hypothetical protein